MDIRKLQRAIVDGLEDVKAQDILVFNTEHLSPLFERVIIASGTSNRQTKALSSSVRESVKAAGFDVPRCEGEDNGEWIIVDCGAAVCHIMQPAIRDYYRLEEIWGGKPVKMKLGDAKTGLVKASEGSDAAAKKKAPARKPSATARSAAGQAALEKPAKAAKPAPARKVTSGGLASAKAAPKTAAPKKAAPKKAVTRTSSGSVAKAPARKSPSSKAPMKLVVVKPAARKTAAKSAAKPAARKAAPKKTGR
jgi:ribosome-associated protein